MNIISNDNIVFFDCDGTLVIWEVPNDKKEETVLFDNYGTPVHLLPHKKHIELLRQFKARGHFVIVWSQGGYAWANEVVKLLNIEQYVDMIISKPKWFCDDLPAEAFMGKPIFIPLDERPSPWEITEMTEE